MVCTAWLYRGIPFLMSFEHFVVPPSTYVWYRGVSPIGGSWWKSPLKGYGGCRKEESGCCFPLAPSIFSPICSIQISIIPLLWGSRMLPTYCQLSQNRRHLHPCRPFSLQIYFLWVNTMNWSCLLHCSRSIITSVCPAVLYHYFPKLLRTNCFAWHT